MKRLALFACALALTAAGCTSAPEDPEDDPSDPGNSTAAFDELTEPYDLQITAPEGFAEVDPVRDPALSDDQKTWSYALTGGHADSLLSVTAYYLPDGVTAADFASQTELILAYEEPMGNTIEASNIYPALVHRYTGVHRYFKSESGDDGSLFMRNFFMFAGQHVIQLTCQWRQDFDAVSQGCEALAQNFPYPEGWPETNPAA